MQDVKKCPFVSLGLTASPPAMRPTSESSSRPGGSVWAAVVCCLALVLPFLVAAADTRLGGACQGKPCTDGEVLASQQDGAVQYNSFSTCVGQFASGRKCVAGNGMLYGDPDFIVGVQGMQQPLCFRLEGEPGQVIRLLQDPDTGVVVNAQITQPVPGLKKTYLGAVHISRRNFQVVARLGHIAVNSYKFLWGPTSARLVHGHRILIAPTLMALTLRHRNVTLVVKRHMPEDDISDAQIYGGNDDKDEDDYHDDVEEKFASPSDILSAANASSRDSLRYRRLRRQGNRRDGAPKSTGRGRKKNADGHKGRRGDRKVGGRKSQQGRQNTNDVTSAAAVPVSKTMPTTMKSTRTSSRATEKDAMMVSPGPTQKVRSRQTQPTPAPKGNKTQSRDAQRRSLVGRQQDNVAYMGFYVTDARDLSPDTHGLLGQFLHKTVTIQRVRRKAGGRVKAMLLVGTSRRHVIKASLRTRTNLVLNASSTCWWVKEGGSGAVDGDYHDYLVPTLRFTHPLPLPPPPDLSK